MPIRAGGAAGLGEDSTLEPTNPYSAAKAGAEMMARAYRTSYRLPVITTRGNNVYGPHQFPEKMIPKFTLLASRGQDLPIHGDGARPCQPLPSEAAPTAPSPRFHVWARGRDPPDLDHGDGARPRRLPLQSRPHCPSPVSLSGCAACASSSTATVRAPATQYV